MLRRMHKPFTILAAAAVLFGATACSSSTTASVPAVSTPKPSPSPASSKSSCTSTRDVIVRYVAPGQPATAQELGNYNLATCQPTLEWLQNTSPTGPGYCTEAAWVSDNPNYSADTTPAAPLKEVQVRIGPAC